MNIFPAIKKPALLTCIIMWISCNLHHFDSASIKLINESKIKIVEYHELRKAADTAFDCGGCSLADAKHPYYIKPGFTEPLFIDKISSVSKELEENKDLRLMVYIFNYDTCIKYKDAALVKKTVLKRFDLKPLNFQHGKATVIFQ